ncbi:MAG: homoserine kinase [Alphaproteobacteria bacterium]|nr:homoserine kinase [Alphaproteobacteria bacterium]
MAVFTRITLEELQAFLEPYETGPPVSFAGIARGVSNTNYHVFTTRGRFILTIFEERRTRRADLPFLFAWAAHLAARGINCPQAILDKNGRMIHDIQEKPAVLISFLEGEDIPRGQTTPDHCAQMGEFTARMHRASAEFQPQRENDWPLARMENISQAQAGKIKKYSPELNTLIAEEIAYIRAHWPEETLPRAVVHCDLFPDNVFFREGRIVSMIDLYFGCTHALVYDLAIVANAWCFDGAGHFQERNFHALLAGYEGVRLLEEAERAAFQTACRLASLRFLMSRLEEYLTHDPAESLMTPHDPGEYLDRLRFHRARDIIAA